MLPEWNGPSIEGKSVWDSLYLGVIDMPGIWRIKGNVGQKIDVKTVKGQKGAKTTNEGPQPAELVLHGILSYEEAVELEIKIDQIHPRKTNQMSSPMSLGHPSAAFLGISSVRVKDISLPQIVDDNMEIEIRVIEYFDDPEPAKPKPAKPAKPPEEADTPQVTEHYPPADPWAPSGIDVLDQQWPPDDDSVNGNNPWPPSPQVSNGLNPWAPA